MGTPRQSLGTAIATNALQIKIEKAVRFGRLFYCFELGALTGYKNENSHVGERLRPYD